jgi:hypothetical protein
VVFVVGGGGACGRGGARGGNGLGVRGGGWHEVVLVLNRVVG